MKKYIYIKLYTVCVEKKRKKTIQDHVVKTNYSVIDLDYFNFFFSLE